MQSTKFIKKIKQKKWILIDAKDVILGRLASFAAMRLQGKNRPDYTPHVTCGECIVIINADKIKFTGNNKGDKKFYWHTGYVGGIKSISFDKMLLEKPEQLIKNAVRRMLPKTKLGKEMLTNLRVFRGESHNHSPQNPELVNFISMNPKNNIKREVK